jgi:phosphatidylglycerophosphate synthase
MISMGSVVFATVAAWWCAEGYGHAAIAAWWFGRLLDGTDGIYARATNQVSDFGAYFDIVCDMTSYSVMILGFMVQHPTLNVAWALVLFLYVLCIASALALGSLEEKRNLAARDNRGLRLGAGLVEGGETGIMYTLFLLFPSSLSGLLKVWILLLAATIAIRTILAWRVLAPVVKADIRLT